MSSIVPSPIRHKTSSNRSSAGVGSNAPWFCRIFPIAIRLCDWRPRRSIVLRQKESEALRREYGNDDYIFDVFPVC